jgi:hypothetical protein
MKNNMRWLVAAVAAVVILGALAASAEAQVRVMPNYSPRMYIAPGLAVNQYARLSSISPYYYGYNYPYTYNYNSYYVPPVVNYYPVTPYYATPPYPYYRPYPVLPYSLYGNTGYPYYLR